jgi:hypothetical protein
MGADGATERGKGQTWACGTGEPASAVEWGAGSTAEDQQRTSRGRAEDEQADQHAATEPSQRTRMADRRRRGRPGLADAQEHADLLLNVSLQQKSRGVCRPARDNAARQDDRQDDRQTDRQTAGQADGRQTSRRRRRRRGLRHSTTAEPGQTLSPQHKPARHNSSRRRHQPRQHAGQHKSVGSSIAL